MFGANGFPLGPNGQYPRQRINSYGNMIASPSRVEEIYERSDEAQLPVVEKDFHSSINRVKKSMKQGSPNKHADSYGDVDRFKPRYAKGASVRPSRGEAPDEWLKRRKQRFPGLTATGPEIAADRVRARKVNPATGMSGVGFFGRNGNLGDNEQRYQENYNQSLGYYTRRPYR